MKINYNDWFYEFQKYTKGIRGYNDTNWVDMGKRYQQLKQLNSKLFGEQPFGVAGNTKGFEKLLDLMVKSNYQFSNINESLIKTYEHTLRGAMSKMMVNTHAVIFHATSLKDPNIHTENLKATHIIDIPYDQMHFGERDEFIRQKLQKMHNSVNRQFISMTEFTSNPFTKILGFTCICTINGKICNDFYIGYDDQGLRFKFTYGGLADAEIMIYKLDNTIVDTFEIPVTTLTARDDRIVYLFPTITNPEQLVGKLCIIDLYSEDYRKTMQVVPHFGMMQEDGRIRIDQQQNALTNMIDRLNLTTLNVIVYFPHALHEINGIYPATNYMHMTKLSPVYTDLENVVTNVDGNQIVASDISSMDTSNFPICTPPICIDRTYDLHFHEICECVNLYEAMHRALHVFDYFGEYLSNHKITTFDEYRNIIGSRAEYLFAEMENYGRSYVYGMMITGLVDASLFTRFYQFIEHLRELAHLNEDTWETYQDYMDDEFYGGYAYEQFVLDITKPFRECQSLNIFRGLTIHSKSNLTQAADSHEFNRPVSEQCFIALQYSQEEDAWLFAYPKMKHFKGIENTFYINDDLQGNEVFKFFVLYTDTKYPSATPIDDAFEVETVLDYDTFITEVEHHLGFIRYWEVENQLMKLSKMLYMEYTDQSIVQIMSDILCGKLQAKDLVHHYWSSLQYDDGTKTSDNANAYDETSDRAPFAINYLFYTLALMNGNDDALQTFFYRTLTDDKYNDRYLDYNISSVIDHQPKLVMNFSKYNHPQPDLTDSNLKMSTNNMNMYWGMPGLYRNDGTAMDSTNYPYAFTVNTVGGLSQHCPLIEDGRINTKFYLGTNTLANSYSLYYDIQLAKLYTKYLNCIRDLISYLETNYKIGVNQTFAVQSGMESLQKIYDEISSFYKALPDTSFLCLNKTDLKNMIDNEPFLKHTQDGILHDLLSIYKRLQSPEYFFTMNLVSWDGSQRINSSYQSLYKGVNWWLRTLRYMYFVYGFKTQTIRRVRNIYLHLKKFHKVQNVHRFKQLCLNFDAGFIKRDMQYTVAEWDQSDTSKPVYVPFPGTAIRNNSINFVTGLKLGKGAFDQFDEIMESIQIAKAQYLSKMETYVNKIMQQFVFDLYVIDDLVYKPAGYQPDPNTTVSFTTKPMYAKWTVIRNVQHPQFHPPYSIADDTKTLYFAVDSKFIDGSYVMKAHGGLRKICEYAFFQGTTILRTDDENAEIEIYDKSGTRLAKYKYQITFRRVGNSADLLPDMEMLSNITNSRVDLQNIHEEIQTVENGVAISQRVTNTNYEMLLANRYQQLDHTYEMILDRETLLPGPIDRLYISNQDINQFILSDLGSRPTTQLFFKPSQVMHITGTDDSVGSGLCVSQKVYLMTNDELQYVFPVEVTAIDHSMHRGFVEAKVDSRHAKWFEIKDKNLIERYLTSDVECHIVPDNISNFLDEFSNETYRTFYNPTFDPELEYTDEDYDGMISVPGDPIYVQNNANYVYTRINGRFPSIVPDPYMDDEHKQWRFHYMGWNQLLDEDGCMSLQLLNVNRSLLTDPELYPILRQEPNDHDVWKLEQLTYQSMIDKIQSESTDDRESLDQMIDRREDWYSILQEAKTEYDREIAQRKIQDFNKRIETSEALIKRIKTYVEDPEQPTTWFNVSSYDAAKVYINNNRTKLPRTYQFDIRDIRYAEQLKVYLYDWEHKRWMDPSTYSVSFTLTTFDQMDAWEDQVIRTGRRIRIQPNDGFVYSHKILIYFAYQSSDVFKDTYAQGAVHCQVRFKPILSTNHEIPEDPDAVKNDMYKDLSIRKHVDYQETYTYDDKSTIYFNYAWMNEFYGITGFTNPTQDMLYIRRPNSTKSITEKREPDTQYAIDRMGTHSGHFPFTPVPRFCHLSVINKSDDIVYDVDNFSLNCYIRNPFKDTTTSAGLVIPSYEVSMIQEIDHFKVGETVKLICINHQQAEYDGNISSIMFQGETAMDEDGNQIIKIIGSTLTAFHDRTYTCTIFHDSAYACVGGLIRIHVTSQSALLTNDDGTWVQIPPALLPYHEIPDEFLIVSPIFHESGSTVGIEVHIDTSYKKQTTDLIQKDNSGTFNPFEFYYDHFHKIRYPISNIRHEQFDKRLTYKPETSTRLNDSRVVVRTNYVSVCRYCLNDIPKNGLIDVTGYIPTPLSRTRYEFWVNGRQLRGTSNVVILSPTSFQLIHLSSLKNFELIELMDDMYENTLSNKGNVYIDIEGNVYNSYQQAFLSNHAVLQQHVRFAYNGYPNHDPLQNYTTGLIANPNNVDVETNIMDYWDEGAIPDDDRLNYNNYYNIPTLNGVSMYHPITDDLGMYEIPNTEILKQFDLIWKKEITTNPLFPTTHFDGSMIVDQQYVLFHIIEKRDVFEIYTTGTYSKYFTLYLSKNSYASIESIENTVQIIPFIRTGTHVLLDKSVRGLWLHATIENELPKKIQ